MSRCSEVVSRLSGRPSRSRSKCRSAASSSALRSSDFSGARAAGGFHVAAHEDAERGLQALADALVEGGQLGGAFGGELIIAFDFLRRQLAQVLVDDVADVLEIDGERHDLHGAMALALVEAVAGELGDVELDRFVERVDDVVAPRHVAGELAVVGHQRGHDVAQHGLDRVAHAQRLARGIGERQRRRFQRGFVEIARHRRVVSRVRGRIPMANPFQPA